ncbi:uncharacterized protein LOC110891559 [Helianthus annuus]|uniref:uncharacterized protein LOC110891559 n=1 Tax=Helianthus annuus TaxID=4232 RepID=UPI000B901F0E|nr:uncharacterized protein LOC110891559 [Helianthus annuus]
MWKPDVFSDDLILKNQRYLMVSGKVSNVEDRVNMVNLHAPNDARQRRALWDEISMLIRQYAGIWIFFGDFNDVWSEEERVNSRFDCGAADAFNGFITRAELLEYSMIGGKFTYISGHADVKLSKLNRFLVNDLFMSRWPCAKVEVQSRGFSDHCPISLWCNNTDFGPIPFNFFSSWVGEQKLLSIVQDASAADLVGGKKDAVLGTILKRIKGDIKKWRKEVNEAENMEVNEMVKTIEEIKYKATLGPILDSDKKIRMDLRVKVRDREQVKAKNMQ